MINKLQTTQIIILLVLVFTTCKKASKNYPFVPHPPIEYEEALIFEDDFNEQDQWEMDTIRTNSGFFADFDANYSYNWKFDGALRMASWIVNPQEDLADQYYYQVRAKREFNSQKRFYGYKIRIGIEYLRYFVNESAQFPSNSPGFYRGHTEFRINLDGVTYSLHGKSYQQIEGSSVGCHDRFTNDTLEYTIFVKDTMIMDNNGSLVKKSISGLWHLTKNEKIINGCMGYNQSNNPINKLEIANNLTLSKGDRAPLRGGSTHTDLDFIKIYGLKPKD